MKRRHAFLLSLFLALAALRVIIHEDPLMPESQNQRGDGDLTSAGCLSMGLWGSRIRRRARRRR